MINSLILPQTEIITVSSFFQGSSKCFNALAKSNLLDLSNIDVINIAITLINFLIWSLNLRTIKVM